MTSRGTDPLFAAGDDALLIPTNRYNLLEILSSRLVAPRAAYDKYYADYSSSHPAESPCSSAA